MLTWNGNGMLTSVHGIGMERSPLCGLIVDIERIPTQINITTIIADFANNLKKGRI